MPFWAPTAPVSATWSTAGGVRSTTFSATSLIASDTARSLLLWAASVATTVKW
jgi:hypothetical protein